MTYRIFEGDDLVDEVEACGHWWTIAPDQLLAEIAAAGLTAERRYPDLFIIRQAGA